MLKADYESMPSPCDYCEPEHKLLMALLERALRDALGTNGLNAAYLQQSYRRRAQDWFGLHEPYEPMEGANPFSFQWVCEHLQVEPRRLHAYLSEALAHGPRPELVAILTFRIRNRCFRRSLPPRKMKTAA